MAEYFMKPIVKEELKSTVFQLGAFKAPGADGLSSIFYQYY